MAKGLHAGRDIKKHIKAKKWKSKTYIRRTLRLKVKSNPLEGSPQAKAIVLEKRQIEQKQPHSGLIKCVRVQLIKNGKQITVFCPGTGAIGFIKEQDEVTVAGQGGSDNGPVGSLASVKWRVIKVNGQSLHALVNGKIKKK
ncbi:MAG: 30S ribosomal protein S12 [Candidatus Nanohalarchaeota archaeon]|nr:MAG: 30S ribosomal protein S12 [Candidatus Nanohaloarchaeota archaeon]